MLFTVSVLGLRLSGNHAAHVVYRTTHSTLKAYESAHIMLYYTIINIFSVVDVVERTKCVRWLSETEREKNCVNKCSTLGTHALTFSRGAENTATTFYILLTNVQSTKRKTASTLKLKSSFAQLCIFVVVVDSSIRIAVARCTMHMNVLYE